MRAPIVIVTAATLILSAGCGGGPSRPQTTPVTGKLMYKDPKRGLIPAAGALVVFNPVNQTEKDLYYPQGKVGEDGTFTLSTWGDADGAPPGEYGVTVLWKPGTKAIGGEDRGQGEDRLGRRYADPKSPRLKQTVTAGRPNEVELVVE